MSQKKGPPDLWLFLIVIFLIGIGIIMVFSSSYYDTLQSDPFYYLKKQSFFAAVGLGLMLLALNIPYGLYRHFAKPLLVVVIGLLITVYFFKDTNGSHRWIPMPIGGFKLQPSEIAKFAVALFISDIASRRNYNPNQLQGGLGKSLLILAVILGLIYKEPDLGTTVAIAAMSMVILLVAGLKWRYCIGAGLIGAAGVAFIILRTPYQMARILGFLDPWSHASGKGYQLINSLYALGSGGFWGVGIGNSKQKLGFLPEQNTDFIFAIIGEELGFIGAGFIVILFLLLAWRGYMIAARCQDTFGCLLATGIVTSIVIQAGFNLGVVTGCLPVTGIALPFISYGGSSLLMSMGVVGILLNISRYQK
jgi:cell division protein FtsW